MNEAVAAKIRAAASATLSGEATFPEIVGTLLEAGVERYHVDYSRQESTFYLPCGDSLVVATPHPSAEVGGTFVPAEVEAAVRASQRNEHSYLDFLEKTMHAGCVGYFAQLAGRRVLYFGRNGEVHVEPFPAAPAA